MDGWKEYIGRKVFILLRSGRQYSGVVKTFDDPGENRLYFLTIIDKFGMHVTLSCADIVEIKEEN